jgi:subtilisin family serine protease
MKYIIDFVDNTTAEAIQQWLTANQATIVREFNTFTKTYLIETLVEPVRTEIIEHINIDAELTTQLLATLTEAIEPTNLPQGSFDTETDWWKTATIYTAEYDNSTISHAIQGAKTSVYLFDSGIKADHPEFANANITNLYTVDGSYDDTRGHGTALASLIVGNTCGITSAQIKNVKIFSTTTVTMLSDFTHALDVTLTAILANPTRYNIVNMSWAIPKNTYIESKIDALINAGAIVVASAGNSGIPVEQVTPASMARVVTVGAYNQSFTPASFSNYSGELSTTPNDTNHGLSGLSGWAPGVDIRVASINGGTITASGTSLSAAIATACIAFNGDYHYLNDELVYAVTFQPLVNVFKSFGKPNILDLTDPKYVGSTNKIAIFYNSPTKDQLSHSSLSTSFTVRVYPNVFAAIQFMPSNFIRSMTITGDIPAGLSLSNGWLVGTITDDVQEQYDVKLVATYEFNTGEIASSSILIKVSTSSDAVPPIDKTIDITLQAGGCEWNTVGQYCQEVDGPGGACATGCINCGTKSFPFCICQFESECP